MNCDTLTQVKIKKIAIFNNMAEYQQHTAKWSKVPNNYVEYDNFFIKPKITKTLKIQTQEYTEMQYNSVKKGIRN